MTLKLLKNNKAPGSDGLRAEFYKAFWDDVKDLLIESINEGFVKKEISFTQERGIITLLFRKTVTEPILIIGVRFHF